MAILFSACVSYSVMNVFVCLLEQYDVTSVYRVLLLSRMIVTSFFSFYFSSGTLLFNYFFFFPQIHIPKIEMQKRKYDVNYLEKITNRFIALSNTAVQDFNSVVGNGELAHKKVEIWS